jgi:hypothetical protein
MADFVDTFTDTGGTALGSHTPDTGTAWTLAEGSTQVFFIADSGTEVRRASGATQALMWSDDLGSADHLTIARTPDQAFDALDSLQTVCVRATDRNNHIGWRWHGTGATGSRVTKWAAGSSSDIILVTGASTGLRHGWIKVEAEANEIRLYHGGTGSSPSWSLMGSVSESFNNSVTRQGLSKNRGDASLIAWLTQYEASSLGGSTTPTLSAVSAESRTSSSIVPRVTVTF